MKKKKESKWSDFKNGMHKYHAVLLIGLFVLYIGILRAVTKNAITLEVYLFSFLSSLFFIGPLHRLIIKIERDKVESILLANKKLLKKEKKCLRNIINRFKNKRYWLPAWIGLVEQPLYITAIILHNSSFIVVWLGFKVAGIWKIWEEDKDRMSFNTFILGNALSLLNAFFWVLIFNKDRILIR